MSTRYRLTITILLAALLTGSNAQAGVTVNGSVFGGGNLAKVQTDATVKISGANSAIVGDVFGGGNEADVLRNTSVTISGGSIGGNVYGGGKMGSVGAYTYTKHNPDAKTDGALYNFALSWPYEFTYETYTDAYNQTQHKGKTIVNISGGRIAGDVYGAGKGQHEGEAEELGAVDANLYSSTKKWEYRYTEALIANVRETEVIIDYSETADISDIGTANCIVGSVYGGGEDGHVYENASVTINEGLIGGSVYGGGRGEGFYTGKLLNKTDDSSYDSDEISNWLAGKVYGNTYLTMNGGHVVKNIYGGGNLGSVGKGNYSGGTDDYSVTGYGELPPKTGENESELWIADDPFMTSGIATVAINSGTIGSPLGVDENSFPTGNVFGSSRGKVAIDVGSKSPRYKYAPDFFLGYVNQTSVKIGQTSEEDQVQPRTAPIIYGSVYGGGQDGHVRRSTEVTINKGTIGQAFSSLSSLSSAQKKEIGNVFGAGSGLGLNSEDKYNTSSGSVTCTTTVTINGGTIYQNVYGGGAMASVGPPKLPAIPFGLGFYELNNTTDEYTRPDGQYSTYTTHKSLSKTEVNIVGSSAIIGTEGFRGNVYGASRGADETEKANQYNNSAYSTDIWSTVTVSGGTITGSVFGGGEAGEVMQDAAVSITGGTIGVSVFGGGDVANVNRNANVNVSGENASIAKAVYGGGNEASVTGNTSVSISNGTIANANLTGTGVYGGCNTEGTIGGNASVLLTGGTIGATGSIDVATGEITYSNDKKANVHGGGYGSATFVKGNVEVQIGELNTASSLIVWGDVYGGSAEGHVNAYPVEQDADEDNRKYSTDKTTTVSLYAGIINGDAYGGGLGTTGNTPHPAYVGGDVTIELNGKTENSTTTTVTGKGAIVNRIFGANNANGSPKGNVTVHVYATQNKITSKSTSVLNKFVSEKVVKETLEDENATVISLKAILADQITVATALNINIDSYQETYDDESATVEALKTAINSITTAINAKDTENDINTVNTLRYDVNAVYGGGNEAAYIPASPYTTSNTTGAKSHVIIEGCSVTSIETVYGGGNAASVPETNVDIVEAYEIGTVFGGGNGKDDLSNGDPNPGADVGVYKNSSNQDVTYGTGNANATLIGGYIHEAYGGSNEKGTIKGKANLNTAPDGSCDLVIGKMVGAGKNADIDGDVLMKLDCMPSTKIPLLFAGADNANVYGNVELTITNGTFGKVFGGNNEGGAIFGRVKVNVEETGCRPINIDELYTCGNEAAYSVYGYKNVTEGGQTVLRPRTSLTDGTAVSPAASNYSSTQMYADPEVNIISCTYIGQVFGGGLGSRAIVYGNPKVNINMAPGAFANQIDADGDGSADNNADALGAVVDVYGGGNKAAVYGNTMVNIGTTIGQSVTLNTNATATITGANITGTVYGAGKGLETDHTAAVVMGNTQVNMAGGHVRRSIYGGGELASVGTIHYATAEEATAFNTAHPFYTQLNEGMVAGEAYSFAENTGLTEVIISGGMVGLNNQKMPRPEDPTSEDDHGYVFCAGKGLLSGDASANKFAVSGSSHLEISGSAFITASVYGGSENGQVLGNTLVEIKGGQIGGGYYKDNSNDEHWDDPYTAEQWNAVITKVKNGTFTDADAATFHECDAWPFGEDGNRHVYDYYYGTTGYDAGEGRKSATDGHSFFGHVFGGGSGYYPYAAGEWRRKAGRVCGNSVVEITGGHILSNVYGGNEITDVLGSSTVTMTAGTIGVPRTVSGIQARPVNSNLYGGCMGDPRTWANQWSNVESSIVTVGGTAVVFGSVFGGGEDGHVLGDASTTIQGTATIGTSGNSGVDGNVYGGGRGFSGIALTAGVICGNVTLNINGSPKILGSAYGGGRMAAVGTYLAPATGDGSANYGKMQTGDDHGNVEINISGGTIGNLNQMSNSQYSIGDVFGGSKGVFINGEWAKSQELGLVKNTKVNISQQEGSTTTIYGNVYGGGELASVGSYTYATAATGRLAVGDVSGLSEAGTGLATLNITGGIIGRTNSANSATSKGHVFGGCLGKAGHDYSGYSFVNKSDVIIGGTAYITGSVFGGGENGHILEESKVTVNPGTGYFSYGESSADNGKEPYPVIGTPLTLAEMEENLASPIIIYRGNVYGGGRGIDNDAGGQLSRTAGAVLGHSIVNINGGTIRHDVYGGGSMASVGTYTYDNDGNVTEIATGTGKSTVTIDGGLIGMSPLLSVTQVADDQSTTTVNEAHNLSGINNGHVFGGGRGQSGSAYKNLAFVNETEVNINQSSGKTTLICGAVFGGGCNGHVKTDTYVTMTGGTIGHELAAIEKDMNFLHPTPIYFGNVYGGGRGIDHANSPSTISRTAGQVYGNTHVEISGGLVHNDVYGGGSLANVGVEVYDENWNVTSISSGGYAYVTIKGDAQIGTDGHNAGYVYGSGRGMAGALWSDMAFVDKTFVTIGTEGGDDNPQIRGSVFGGGSNGHVEEDTDVKIYTGTIGTPLTAAEMVEIDPEDFDGTATRPHVYRGNVYGGGRGVERDVSGGAGTLSATAGRVFGNTKVTVAGGTIYHNIYGGGSLASVGTFTEDASGLHFTANTGDATIIVNGGTIGMSPTVITGMSLEPLDYTGMNNGQIYGSGRGEAGSAYSDLAFVNNTFVTINDGDVYGAVFGGGANGHVKTSTNVTITGGTIGVDDGDEVSSHYSVYRGNVYGGGRGIDIDTEDANTVVSPTAGKVYGNTEVNVTGGIIYHNVYGGGSLASVGTTTGTAPNLTFTANTGETKVTVSGGTIGINSSGNGCVFGSGRGYPHPDMVDMTYVNKTDVKIQGSADIRGCVFGSGDNGQVYSEAKVTMTGGTVGTSGGMTDGNLFGSGRGSDKYTDENDGNALKYNASSGLVHGNTIVNMTGGTIKNNVYGGGFMASVTGSANVTIGGTSGSTAAVGVSTYAAGGTVYGGSHGELGQTNLAKVGNTVVSIQTGAAVQNNVFGGGENGAVLQDVSVSVSGGTVTGDVYGGGALANTNIGNVTNYGTNNESISSTSTYTTTVNLTGGTIGNAYGGGLGRQAATGIEAIDAMVYGDVTVTVNGTAFSKLIQDDYVKKGRVFGCNNLQGTPKGNVNVTVLRTTVHDQNGDIINTKPTITSDNYTNPNSFELIAVYGGGNQANYNPVSGKNTQVNIHGCDLTNIMQVYGSGNSADVPTSDVIIWGSDVIGTVFGGGNGSEPGSPGANVEGLAKITLKSGEIYDVFGASNTKGTCGSTEINDQNTSGGDCNELKIRNMYGAGKSADVIGNVTVDISGCNTSDGVNVYAGSYNAKITGSVTLNITGGVLNDVFAGNNAGGSIGGPIVVNVEEADDCKPIIINNLYGGGNLAAYPGEGAKTYIGPANPTDSQKEDPNNFTDFNSGQITLNVRSCTYIGNIFGGGYGSTAGVTGDTEVNINLTKGNWANATNKTYTFSYENIGVTKANADDIKAEIETKIPNITASVSDINTTTKTFTATIKNEIGTIGNVYGSGNEGKVTGNAVVNIGTEQKVYYVNEPVQFRTEPSTPLTPIASGTNKDRYEATVEGAYISGNVYGGGKEADVTENTYVNICAKESGTTYNSVPFSISQVIIGGNVFGGGKGKDDNFECDKAMVGVKEQGVYIQGEGENAEYTLIPGGTNVLIGNGTISGNVYGGGEIARVEMNTQVTIGLPPEQGGTSAPVVKGSVFAAGAGVPTHGYSALTRGTSTVTVQEQAKIWNNVYGGGELASVGRYWVASTPALATAHNVSVGMPYGLKAGGTSTVVIQDNATIGDEHIANSGNVFGAGMGIEPLDYDYASGEDGVSGYSLDEHKPKRMMNFVAYDSETGKGHNPDDQNKTWKYYVDEEGHEDQRYVWEYFANRTAYLQFIETLALSAQTDVTINGSNVTVIGSVYGGSQKGFVYRNTDVKIQDGTIENDVYGGGLGLASYSKAGQVGGNTYVTISNGAIRGNVHGGGKLGPVGTFVVSADMRNFYWTNNLLANIDPADATTFPYNNTGVCNVTINGGTIGFSGVTMNSEGSFANGNVFGSGKGLDDTFWCEKGIAYSTNIDITGGTVNGNVYGGGEVGRVETNATVNIGDDQNENSAPTIVGNVFGGGAGVKTHGYSGLIRGNTHVTILSKATVSHNVYGGGQIAAVGKYYLVDATYKENHPESNLEIGMPYSLVSDALGISNVTVIGNAEITGNVFGAGKGKEPETYTFADNANRPKRMMSYNPSLYTESNHSIWEFADANEKYVWEYFDTKPKYQTFLETLGLSTQAFVTIGGTRNETTGVVTTSGSPTISGSVYGGSESGFVQHHTSVTIAGGSTIGTETTGGDVFGGGLGTLLFAEAGRVRGNTTVNIQDGAINGNVYGGGSLGDVGTITKSADYNYTWKQDNGSTANSINNNNITGTNDNTGICTVNVSGGVIGIDNPSDATKHGNVFGAGRGSSTTWWCEKAIVYATNVSVTGGSVNGNVYGGGEVGRVEDDAKVTIGTPGGTDKFNITGSIFGAGAGIATHGYSALVRGNSDVTVQGKAQVGGSVYGGGEIASVGRFKVVGGLPSKPQAGGNCTVTIQDDAKIGSSGTEHNVFGACKGVTPAWNNTLNDVNRSKSMQLYNNRPKDAQGNEKEIHTYWDYYEPNHDFVWVYYATEADYLNFLQTLALTSNTKVTIDGNSEVYGSVYGGGERGITLGSVNVNMLSGTVHQDIYGGGSLANSNVAMWDAANQMLYDYVPLELIPGLSHVTGYYTKSGNDYTLTSNDIAGEGEANSYYAQYKTNVNLLGGIIGGNAYGGGLGDLATLGTGHSNVEAKVYGDVKVNLNGLDASDYDETIHGPLTSGEGARLKPVVGSRTEYMLKDDQTGAIVNKIFGCNNLNGTPMAHVKVHVFATQNKNKSTIATADKFGHPLQEENETLTAYLDRLAVFYTSGDAAALISAAQTANTTYNNAAESEKEAKLTALNNALAAMNTELNKFYDVEAVYGGGNLAKYEPADPTPSTPYNDTEEFTEVIIDGCGYTSIKQVYGGGNAAPAAATYVCVNGTYEIDEVFGGGNGADSYTLNENGTDIWHENPGANVGYRNYTHWESSTSVTSPGNAENPYHLAVNNTTSEQGGDASTADLRRTNYGYGTGVATTDIRGGTIHYVFGGSNKKGNISTTALSVYSEADDECKITIHESYGGGKDAPIDGEINVTLDCVKDMDMIFGGAKNAEINNNVTLNITNGTFKKVFGGNNTSGAINGSITVNIEEKGCVPINIEELYGGGYLAPYSKYGYKKDDSGRYIYYEVDADNNYKIDPSTNDYIIVEGPADNAKLMPLNADDEGALDVPHNDPRINIISASRIGTVYGGGYKAKVVGSPHVNVNMTEGKIPSQYVTNLSNPFVGNHTDDNDNILWVGKEIATSGDGILEIGTIDTVYGGGNLADIVGNTYVEIGTGKWISWDDQGNPIWETEDASGKKYKSSQTSNAVTYSQAECNAYNKNLKGYIASTKVLTSAQATAVNTKLGTSYNENDVIYVEDAAAYNATLEGLRKTTDVKTPAVYYTQAECDEYNSAHNLSIGDAGYRKATDIKTPAVYYTQAECSAYNAENISDYIACTATLEAKKAVAVNEAIGANYAAGATIYTEDAAAFNATLNGYLTTADVKTPAIWTWYDVTAPSVPVDQPTPARNAANITGDVYGGGKGLADNFTCNKAMVGVDGDGVNNPDGGTNVTIANGTIGGSVYGGGKIARVEKNTVVTIGLGDGVDETTSTPTSAPVINGNVFGAGKGVETHGYSALVRGNPTVIIQGNAKVEGSVYGGGEIASVARYKVVNGSPVALANKTSGNCKVIIRGYAEVGPDNMKMYHVDGNNNIVENDKPDDTGHVFGAGKGILPKIYSYEDKAHKPRRMLAKGTPLTSGNSTSEEYDANNIWEYFGNDEDYHKFIETLALSSKTDVTITDNAFVKGSVYGGSQNGIVQYNTHVTIDGDCQIGAGEGVNRRYTPEEWAYDGSDNAHSLRECAHWDYDITSGAPYDPFAKATGQYDYTESNYSSIPDSKKRSSTAGGMAIAKDGHTYYGNVFGGGSGVEPYAPGLWHRAAGLVRGNTVVDITGGHILTSVYGGNEHTDVGIYDNNSYNEPAIPVSGGLCTVNFGGTATLGVPRTLAQIAAHPVTCYLFGAGKGDTRIFFNTWTNIREAEVNITGGKIFGSVFGGGEDGHVLENITVNINEHDYTTNHTNTRTLIGTTGTSYVDGNVFGAGRGFTGDALTAGSVGGNVEVNISGGIMLGSIYGGGRLASVGTQFNAPNDLNYGNFVEDGNGKTYGHVTVNISGGTIGNENATGSEDAIKHSGNVFGGSMGRLNLLDNTTRNPIWPRLAQVKTAAVNIYGNARILRNVYGGSELGTVRDNAFVTVGGYLNPDVTNGSIPNPVTSDLTITKTDNDNPTIERDVYGGGYGSKDRNHTIFTVTEPRATATAPFSEEDYEEHTYAFTPMQFAGCVGKNTYVNIVGGWIKKNTYGGGEMASVGIIDCLVEEISNVDTSLASVVIQRGAQKSLIYKNMRDHSRFIDSDDRFLNFGISWPFEFSYITGYKGTTHVNVTGGRLGITGKDYMGSDNTLTDEQKEKLREDNGDVFGAGKGIAGDFHQYVFCANVDSSEVYVNINSDDSDDSDDRVANPTNYKDLTKLLSCITGSVYAGSENGHVLGNTKLTLKNGLIGHAIYGGGKGKGTYNVWLKEIPEGENGVSNITDNDDPSSEVSAPDEMTNGTTTEYKATIYSITAGKVFGNTNVTMTGGYVMRNVYGGGNMGSVGKGNYSGGQDDYSARGYGELPPSGKDLWSTSTYQENETNYAWHFLNSGKSTVTITGGTIGYIDPEDPSKSIKDGLPYGNVFGGCRGESAPNIGETPRYQYSPSSYSGYVNETEVTIGNGISGPTILGSVYGGGQDGHVRRDTKVIINNGVIGIPFSSDNQETLGTDLTDAQWQHRGNVYGAGSGIGKYEYDFNYDGDYLDVVDYYNPQTGRRTLKEKDYSTSAGSVTRFTYVEINDGTIYHNVYGGGSNASIGAPKIPPITDYQYRKGDTQAEHGESKQTLNEVIINGGTIGSTNSRTTGYGGNVYGASRGMSELIGLGFATSVWTNVEAKSGYIYGNIFGGGEAGSVFMDTKVIIGGKVENTNSGSGAPRRTTPAVQPDAAAPANTNSSSNSSTVTPANVATEAPDARSIRINRAQ